MKNTKRAKNSKAVTATPTHADGTIRILITNSSFGPRFLGGADFCTFRNELEARAELSYLSASPANAAVIDEWEFHTFRGGEWFSSHAGVL